MWSNGCAFMLNQYSSKNITAAVNTETSFIHSVISECSHVWNYDKKSMIFVIRCLVFISVTICNTCDLWVYFWCAKTCNGDFLKISKTYRHMFNNFFGFDFSVMRSTHIKELALLACISLLFPTACEYIFRSSICTLKK